MMFAQGYLEFLQSDTLLQIVRIICTIGGAVIGWFAFDPLTRLAYRISFKEAVPLGLLLSGKFVGAVIVGAIVYLFLPLGWGGPGGLGWGPGPGGGPGKGPGPGGDKGVVGSKDAKTDANGKTLITKKTPEGLESIQIVIINRDDDDGTEHWFLLNGKKPALTPAELEDYFKNNHAKIEVTPVLNPTSIGTNREGNPLSQLLDLTKKYKVKTLQTKGP